LSHITYDDFLKVDIRVGKIVQVDDFPKAKKPAYKLRIDFGELGVMLGEGDVVLVRPDREVPVGTRIL